MSIESNPKVSVIIPSRNYGCFLDESIESVLNQTVSPGEVILIDDGSSDDTYKVVEKYLPDVKYYFQDKKGVGAARNRGVELSTGGYIAHLDADDIWVPQKLELQMEEFSKAPALEIAGGLMQPFYSPEMDEGEKSGVYCSPDPLPGFSASVILVKRASFFKVGIYKEDVEISQDLDWFLRAREFPLQEKMVNKLLAFRRLHNSNSSLVQKEHRLERIHMLKESLDRRRKKDPSGSGKR